MTPWYTRRARQDAWMISAVAFYITLTIIEHTSIWLFNKITKEK